jgi:hypothetical protein
VIGNGTIPTEGGQGTFNISVAPGRRRRVKGNFFYSDPGFPISAISKSFSSLTIVGNTAQFSGTARIGNRQKVTFTVYATDNGDPGTADTFSINLSNGYSASGNLTSGNIKIQ